MRVKGRNDSVQLDPSPVVNETHLQSVAAEPDPPSGLTFLLIQLTDEGTALLERATAASVGRRLGMMIDDELISVPKIAERIPNGPCASQAFHQPKRGESHTERTVRAICCRLRGQQPCLREVQSSQSVRCSSRDAGLSPHGGWMLPPASSFWSPA